MLAPPFEPFFDLQSLPQILLPAEKNFVPISCQPGELNIGFFRPPSTCPTRRFSLLILFSNYYYLLSIKISAILSLFRATTGADTPQFQMS